MNQGSRIPRSLSSNLMADIHRFFYKLKREILSQFLLFEVNVLSLISNSELLSILINLDTLKSVYSILSPEPRNGFLSN